tara:strand:+ start:528 stop:986 length:459 start_codon:yes stop_codon:yes gene_type:complete
MATPKLNTKINDYMKATTPFTIDKKAYRVGAGRVDNAVYSEEQKKTVARYRLVINGKESKYLLRSWQSVYQVHQIVLAGDASKLFTKAGDLKSGMDDILGTDKIRETFDYVCPIGLYNNNPDAKKAINMAVKNGVNFKKDNVWEEFLTFTEE